MDRTGLHHRAPSSRPRGRTGLRLTFLCLCLAALAALSGGFGAPAASAAACSTGTIEGSFSAPATKGSLATESQVDCYQLSGFGSGQEVSVGLVVSSQSGDPVWRIVDHGGQTICGAGRGILTRCQLSGAPGWSIEVGNYSPNGAEGTFSYSLAVRNVSEPQGCSSALGEPGEWSFTKARTNGSISGTLGAQCYTFDRAEGEADGSYWLRAVRTAGNLNAHWTVYGPSGGIECSGPGSSWLEGCGLRAFGQYALVVTAQYGEETGSFYISPRRLNQPAGCSSVSSLSFAATPIAGSISTAGQTDCYSLAGASAEDVVTVSSSSPGNSGASPLWTMVDANGNRLCETSLGSTDVHCRLAGSGPWSLVVYDGGGTGSFSYNLAVRDVSEPQGCSSALGDPGEWSFTRARTNGSISGTLGAQCYTFHRAEGEADGAYWFRTVRTAGSFGPQWIVFGPSGSQECAGTENSYGVSPCILRASGRYTLVVDDPNGSPGSYFLTADHLGSAAGCTAMAAQQFGAPALTGNLPTAGAVDCRTLEGVSVGDRVEVGLSPSGSSGGSPHWSVINGDGEQVCGSASVGLRAPCELTGAAGWSILTYGEGAGTFSYSLAVRRLDDPQGCSAALGDPGEWSFTRARTNGSISGTLGAQCYTFHRAEGEADGDYWFRTLRTAGAAEPEWTVYGPSGERECSGYNGGNVQGCALTADGRYALVVESNSGEGSGSYVVAAKRLNAPAGCAPIKSPTFGIGPTHGSISTAGEVDCYSVALGSGDELIYRQSGAANQLAVLGEAGNIICQGTGYPCRVNEDATYSVLLSAVGTESGSYQFEAACQDEPCGLTETAIGEVDPTRVGQGLSMSLTLRGHDLELLEKVVLKRAGTTIEGRVVPGSDGRTAEVRFDLSKAEVGAWEIEGEFADGTKRQLANAVHVEPAGSPIISVHLVGREVFRTFHKIPVSVEVTNNGNVDGIAVPVVLSGLPAGSVVEPQFELAQPEGDLEAPTLTTAAFDQQEDVVETAGGLAVPLFVPRVPAEGSVRLEFDVTVPTGGVSYLLQARAGSCLGNEETSPAAHTAAIEGEASGGSRLGECAKSFGTEVFKTAITKAIPGMSCVFAANDVMTAIARGVINPALGVQGPKAITWRTAFDFGLDAAGCAVPVFGVVGTVAHVVEDAGYVGSIVDVGADCFGPESKTQLPQNQVTAIDPNELVGPSGVGSQRYISGEGPSQYRVFFENTPQATAPAQRIEVTDQLDTSKFDPGSVLFSSFHFGKHSLVLPYPEANVDETVNLQPAEDLEVHVTASVSPAGKVQVILQSIDPDTLEAPSDPEVGLLPPNGSPPEGEGSLDFTVAPLSLASGTTLSNQASIVFDDNPAIVTDTWTNKIDKAAPTPTVAAATGTEPQAAKVTWGGSDDASGIGLWRIEVSKNGGPFEFWRSASVAGSEEFVATEAGTYSFRATASDNAGNSAQSGLAAVTLTAAAGGPSAPSEPGSGGGSTPGGGSAEPGGGSINPGGGQITPGGGSSEQSTGGGSGGATTGTAPSTPPASKPTTRAPKPKQCKKGFKKTKAHGKINCVPAKAKHKKKLAR
jgi:hypothetical protein